LTLEISRQKAREYVLQRFKHIRTCALARELCLLVRTNRAVLNREDVHDMCLYISKRREEAGCKEASELCAKAAEAVLTDEALHLKLCEQSCRKCSESRRPRRPAPERTTYVA